MPKTSKSGIVMHRDSPALGAIAQFADIEAGQGRRQRAADQQRERQREEHHEGKSFGGVAFDVEEAEGHDAGNLNEAEIARRVRNDSSEANDDEDTAGHPERKIEAVGVHQRPDRDHLQQKIETADEDGEADGTAVAHEVNAFDDMAK